MVALSLVKATSGGVIIHAPMIGNQAEGCRVCGQTDLSFLYRVRGCTLEKCSSCQFVQVATQPSREELEATYSDEYFDKGKYEDEFAQRKENERRLALIEGLGLPGGAKVLDAGCATGEFIAFAASRFDMWGIELSAYAAERAREQNPNRSDQIFAGFVEECALELASFDAIVMWDVIEHLSDPVGACAKLTSLLKPGGFFVVSTPDIGAWAAKLFGKRWAFMTPPEHLGFFDDTSMDQLFRELDLAPVSQSSRGKWANVGFIAYKLRRVLPQLMPGIVVKGVQRSPLGRAAIYVPTSDVKYAVGRKET